MSFQTRHSFIFRTKIKIFLMKSESSLTLLHRQQHNWNVTRSRNVARTSVKLSIWHGINCNLTKLHKQQQHVHYFFYFCHVDCFTDVLATFLGLVTFQLCCVYGGGSESSQTSSKISSFLFWRRTKVLLVWNDMRVIPFFLFFMKHFNTLPK